MLYHDGMNRLSRPLIIIALVGLALPLAGRCQAARAADAAAGAAPERSALAVISDPGDSDSTGFRIVVAPDDRASAVDGAGRASGELSPALTDKFFGDLRVAAAASSHAVCAGAAQGGAAASVSIAWHGHMWKNVGCDASAAGIASDALAIARTLYVQRYRTRPMYVYLGSGGNYVSTGQLPSNVYGTGYAASQSPAGGYTSRSFTTFGGYGSSPYTGYPAGSLPLTSLPAGTITGSLPVGSLPLTTPYSGLPSGSLPLTSPYGSSPYGGTPYGSP